MTEQITGYYQAVEKRIRRLKEELEVLEIVAKGCADAIEGLVAVSRLEGKED